MILSAISVYIHWPFCLSLCPYCDFNSHIADGVDKDQWIRAYQQEIDYFQNNLKGRYIKSVFFGGGTPSLMHPKIVESVIERLALHGIIDQNTEITLEANPTSYESEKFKQFKIAGINRVSIGLQSLNDQNLKFLGRKHSANEATDAINSAAEIFDRYSYDLIYALPKQSLADWQNELKSALQFASDHISLYQLTIEKGTPFYRLYHDRKFTLPADDAAADMYEWTNQYLQEQGYNRYEISNYAKPGRECIHNLAYWNYDEYIGIGPGAHGRVHYDDGIYATMMIHSPQKWLDSLKNKSHGIQQKYKLPSSDVVKEVIMMGSRLTKGLSEQKFTAISGLRFKEVLDLKLLQFYQDNGFLSKENEILQLTDKGLLVHNYIISRLI